MIDGRGVIPGPILPGLARRSKSVGKAFAGYLVDDSIMAQANKDALFMHCLPVRRNVVVADEILDGPRSLVIEQANNRTYAAQAVLQTILQGL